MYSAARGHDQRIPARTLDRRIPEEVMTAFFKTAIGQPLANKLSHQAFDSLGARGSNGQVISPEGRAGQGMARTLNFMDQRGPSPCAA